MFSLTFNGQRPLHIGRQIRVCHRNSQNNWSQVATQHLWRQSYRENEWIRYYSCKFLRYIHDLFKNMDHFSAIHNVAHNTRCISKTCRNNIAMFMCRDLRDIIFFLNHKYQIWLHRKSLVFLWLSLMYYCIARIVTYMYAYSNAICVCYFVIFCFAIVNLCVWTIGLFVCSIKQPLFMVLGTTFCGAISLLSTYDYILFLFVNWATHPMHDGIYCTIFGNITVAAPFYNTHYGINTNCYDLGNIR